MRIRYEIEKGGACNTVCPFQKSRGIHAPRVASQWCCGCRHFLYKDEKKHILVCSHPKIKPNGQKDIVKFHSDCFDIANSGKHGHYPYDMEEFNREVEDGFSDGGLTWTAKDGTLFSCK